MVSLVPSGGYWWVLGRVVSNPLFLFTRPTRPPAPPAPTHHAVCAYHFTISLLRRTELRFRHLHLPAPLPRPLAISCARVVDSPFRRARGSDHSLSRARTQARGQPQPPDDGGSNLMRLFYQASLGARARTRGTGPAARRLSFTRATAPLPVPDTARHSPAAIPRRPLRPNDRTPPASPWKVWGCHWHRWGVQAECKPSRSISSCLASRQSRWRPSRVRRGLPAARRRDGRPRPRYAAFHDHDMPLRRRASTAAVVIALFRRSCSTEI